MNTRSKLPIYILAVFMSVFAFSAQAAEVKQDAKAIEVLKQMAAYKATLDKVVITGVTLADAGLGAGLIVSNSEEISVSLNRPGSLRINRFDGETNKGLYFHDGLLTVYSSASMLYAQADIPEEIDAAMEFALVELDVEAPVMDLIYKDAAARLLGSNETILYLTDKSRVGGTNCHQIAIRGAEVDVQLWIEEGDRPVPRRIMITSKWEGGSPRFTANLDWDTNPEFEQGYFEFQAPEGATKIEFVNGASEQ